MRNSYIYKIDSTEDFTNRLIAKSKSTNYISVLLSNQVVKSKSLPNKYINYDLIAGVEKLESIESNEDSFQALRKFHNKYSDWMFGYFSYDLKNEIEELFSENQDGIEANNLSFFIPKFVFLLCGDKLEVLTFQDKNYTDKLFNSLTAHKLSKRHQILLKQKESPADYLCKIDKIKKHIQRGDIYEMNYCLEYYSNDVSLHAEDLFIHLNKICKTPFAGFLNINEHYILSASPERFIRKEGNNIISQPIKGTIKRGSSINEDKKLIYKLENSQKDISENVMITDLVRNDLSITAKKSSVNVDEFCKVYTFEKVHQMISTISSQINSNIHFTDLLESVFPMGSMTGAPKIKAMELIEKYEEFKRGLFSGSIGYITPEGDFDFNVIIRTILYNASTKYLSVGVGGAITIKSDPQQEYEECLLKIRPILEALNHNIDD